MNCLEISNQINFRWSSRKTILDHFHQGIGAERKEERLRFLTRRWADRLLQFDNVKLNTSLKPEFSCALANVNIEGVEPGQLASHMWSKHRIIITPIGHEECTGLRITPHVYTA